MLTFSKTSRQRENMEAARAALVPEEATAEVPQDQSGFVGAFRRMTNEIAKPLFDDLVRVAQGSGYAATIKEGVDEINNPYYAVTFVPEVGSKLGAVPANECIFELKAIWPEQIIEYVSCHDRRPGKKGVRVTKSDLQSINRVFLEAEIEEFVTSSLEAREPT